MKKLLVVLLALAMALAMVPAMAENEDITIVMIGQQLGNVVFLDAEKGMNAAGADLGVTVEWQSPLRAEAELQNEIMLNLLSRGDVDGIAISCTTGDALMASINAALDAGIQVVCYDVDSPTSNREYYIGTENYKAGYTCGEYMIDLYKDSLIFFLMQYVKSADIAEELVEDTFVALAVKKPKFSETAQFKTWLFTIARNKALNYLRSAAFRRSVPLEQAEELLSPDCAEQRLLRQERYRALYAAMDKLNENQREMVYLVYFEDMSIAQAAGVIRKTQRQGNTILFRARQKLKEILQKEGFEYEN